MYQGVCGEPLTTAEFKSWLDFAVLNYHKHKGWAALSNAWRESEAGTPREAKG